MANQIQIVNLALSWLGQQLVNSLNDNQVEAKVMKAAYDLSRDTVLGSTAWTFALRREILSPDATQPAFGRSQRFLIPSDVLRVHRAFRPSLIGGSSRQFLGGGSERFQNARWTREGRYIIADEENLWCIFIFRNTNTDTYPPEFNHALAARLAADTAMTFTENRQLMVDMMDKYEMYLADARRSDGSQGRTEVMRSDILTGVRTR